MSFAGVIVFELGYDGETVRQHEFEGLTFDQVVAAPAELARLREESAFRKELANEAMAKNDRLREENNRLRWSLKNADEDNDVLKAQRDTLLAVLRKIAKGEHNKLCGLPDIARAAISEVEGEKERYLGFGTDDEEAWGDPDRETT